MRYVREHAASYGIRAGRIGFMGFSAGQRSRCRLSTVLLPMRGPILLCPSMPGGEKAILGSVVPRSEHRSSWLPPVMMTWGLRFTAFTSMKMARSRSAGRAPYVCSRQARLWHEESSIFRLIPGPSDWETG